MLLSDTGGEACAFDMVEDVALEIWINDGSQKVVQQANCLKVVVDVGKMESWERAEGENGIYDLLTQRSSLPWGTSIRLSLARAWPAPLQQTRTCSQS